MVALGQALPGVHLRHEMGDVVRLYWKCPTGQKLQLMGDDCPGSDWPLLLHARMVYWSGQKELAGHSAHCDWASRMKPSLQLHAPLI